MTLPSTSSLLLLATALQASDGEEPPPRKSPASEPYRVAIEHILFLHKASFRPGSATRSKEEAIDLARRAAREIRAGKLTFEDGVRKLSEDEASASRGGYIGIFSRDELSDDFGALSRAAFGLEVGAVAEPVETPVGVHVIRRIPIREWSGAHILIQWSGRKKAPASLTRSRDEALALAQKALEEASRPGADFADIARRLSEAPDRVQGGSLGIFTTGEILPALEHEVSRLSVGGVSGPVETELGFHVVRRDALRRARAAHILIRFQGAADSDDVKRTREEALRTAQEILAKARAPRADFAKLARAHSEDGTSRRGGDVGLFTPGQMAPAFEKAAFALEIGAVSDIVETPNGFHILTRLPDE